MLRSPESGLHLQCLGLRDRKIGSLGYNLQRDSGVAAPVKLGKTSTGPISGQLTKQKMDELYVSIVNVDANLPQFIRGLFSVFCIHT